MSMFSKETISESVLRPDLGKVAEVDHHDLLRKPVVAQEQQITSFEELLEIGKLFLEIDFGKAPLRARTQIHPAMFRQMEGKVFLGKLKTGQTADRHFPVMVQVVNTTQGKDLLYHVVPIHFGAFELTSIDSHTDSLLVLAAAAAVAPSFMLDLDQGMSNTKCPTNDKPVQYMNAEHGLPLVAALDATGVGSNSLSLLSTAKGNNDLTVRQVGHSHGINKQDGRLLSAASANTGISGGVKVQPVLRSQLAELPGRQDLFLPHSVDEQTGAPKLLSFSDLLPPTLQAVQFGLVSAVLGFTTKVIGDSGTEQRFERVLHPANAETPLREVLN